MLDPRYFDWTGWWTDYSGGQAIKVAVYCYLI
jgi:hypothetical protein